MGFDDYSYETGFFFNSYQDYVKRVGSRTSNFRKYYYDHGFDRSCNGDEHLGKNDFQ